MSWWLNGENYSNENQGVNDRRYGWFLCLGSWKSCILSFSAATFLARNSLSNTQRVPEKDSTLNSFQVSRPFCPNWVGLGSSSADISQRYCRRVGRENKTPLQLQLTHSALTADGAPLFCFPCLLLHSFWHCSCRALESDRWSTDKYQRSWSFMRHFWAGPSS